MKVLKTIAANLLAVLSLPLMLLSIVFMMIQKLFEKAPVVVCAVSVFLIATFVESACGSGNFPWYTAVLAVIAVGFLIVVFTLLSSVLILATAAVAKIFESLSGKCNKYFKKIYDFCTTEYFATASLRVLKYPVYFLIRLIRSAMLYIFRFLRVLTVVLSVLFFIGVPVYSHYHIYNEFGIGLFEYLKLFTTVSMVMTIIYFIITAAALGAVLVSFGSSCQVWAEKELIDSIIDSGVISLGPVRFPLALPDGSGNGAEYSLEDFGYNPDNSGRQDEFAENRTSDHRKDDLHNTSENKKKYASGGGSETNNNSNRSKYHNRKNNNYNKGNNNNYQNKGNQKSGKRYIPELHFTPPNRKIYYDKGYNSKGVDISGRKHEQNKMILDGICSKYEKEKELLEMGRFDLFANQARQVLEKLLTLLVDHYIGENINLANGKNVKTNNPLYHMQIALEIIKLFDENTRKMVDESRSIGNKYSHDSDKRTSDDKKIIEMMDKILEKSYDYV